ncbi:Alcohol dehydrogenase-like 7 [Linum perenne]
MDSPPARGSTVGKPIRCKAAVCRKAGEPVAIEEVTVDPPRVGEARIRVICTSVCNTDVGFWRMTDSPGGNFPIILGHEGFGVVESVGEDVDDLNPGDRVIPIFLPDCGDQCPDCRSKKSNLCSSLTFKISPWMPRDGTSRFKDLDGNSIHHFLSVSSFSEYTVVDVVHLTKVEDSPLDVANRACLLTCGISAGIGATWRAAEVDEGSTVAIFGLGTIGMAVAEGARLRGAARIIGIDTNPERFEIRKKFGITEFVNPGSYGDKPVSQVIREMTDGGGGADYCFECAGSPFLMEQAYASMKIKCMEVLQSGKMLTGALFGGLKPKSDIPVLLKRYMDKVGPNVLFWDDKLKIKLYTSRF